MNSYTVQQGDCIYSIAAQFGFLWTTIWNLGDNATLKQQRQNPGLLLPGDVVMIPDKDPGEESKPTNQKHSFQTQANPFVLRLQLLDKNHQPRAGLNYVISIDGALSNGTTDDNGRLEEPIDADAKQAVLTIPDADDPDNNEQYQIGLGCVDPPDQPSGAQQRLQNLGLASGLPQTTALMYFQQKNGLPQSGELDDATQACLKTVHGS
jgi:hypothetical protein